MPTRHPEREKTLGTRQEGGSLSKLRRRAAAARQSHKLKVGGSSPPARNKANREKLIRPLWG